MTWNQPGTHASQIKKQEDFVNVLVQRIARVTLCRHKFRGTGAGYQVAVDMNAELANSLVVEVREAV